MSIEIRDISFTYLLGSIFEKKALKKVSFNLKAGELILICGESGSGKSTLLQSMNASIIPQEGSVLLYDKDSKNVKKIELQAIRQKIAILYQFPERQLFERKVFDDIAFGPRCAGITGKNLQLRVKQAMESLRLPYEALKEHSPFTLSTGQKKKVAIAGVLANQPEFILFDEPLSGMDYEGRQSFLQTIKELKEKQVGIVIISHEIGDFLNLCTRLILMSDGKISIDAEPLDILVKDDYLLNEFLDIPVFIQVIKELRSRGWQVENKAKSYKEAAKIIASEVKENEI